MVKIPKIGPGATRLTRQGGIQPVSAEGERRIGHALDILGQRTQEVAQRFETMRDETELMTASNNARVRLADLEQQVIDAPNDWDSDKYTKEISKIKDDTSDLISLPVSKSKYGFSFDTMSLSSQSNMRNTLRKNDIVNGQTALFNGVDLMGEEYGRLIDPAMKKAKVDEMKLAFNNSVKVGLLTPIQARSNIKAQKKAFIEGDIRNKIAEDPDLAEELLTSETWDLSAAEVADWGKAIDVQRKRNEKEAQKIKDDMQIVNESQLMANLRETSAQDIIDLIVKEKISPKVGENLISYKRDSETVSYETDKEIWLEIYRDSLDPEKDIRKFNEIITGAMKDGKIQEKDGLNLVDFVNESFKTAIAHKTQDNPFMRNMRSAMDYVRNWSKRNPTNVLNQAVSAIDTTFSLTNDLINHVKEKQTPAEEIVEVASKLVRDKTLDIRPDIAGFSEKGEIMVSADGSKALVFPDGRYEPIIEKAKKEE